MIDQEVEMVLREIRDRVTSQPLPEPAPARSATAMGNGASNSQVATNNSLSVQSRESLARLNAHLTTTARAWDRLPPIVSNRSGASARLELWIKARLKTFSRWFTWEQVNYNAAVHHALGEALQILSNQEAGIAALRAQLAQAESAAQSEAQNQRNENEARRAELELLHSELDALRAQLQSETAARRIDLQNQQKETNVLRAEMRGEVEALRIGAEDQGAQVRAELENQKSAVAARLSEIVNELREREDLLENEQRVCFKQLSLETSEAVVSNDRAQRKTKALLDDLNQRIKQLESKSRP